MAKAAAIFFSLLCAGLLAYILATRSPDRNPAPPLPAEDAASLPAGASDADLAVPADLRGLPMEWRSAEPGADRKGFAALLDLEGRRELIIESCEHRGYFDAGAGEPRSEDWSFCTPFLWGRVLAVGPGALVVRSRDGSRLDAPIAVRRVDGRPRIALTVEGRRLDLVPGSKNELYQQLDQTGAIRAEAELRDRYLEEQLRQEAKRKAAGEAASP